MGGNGADDGEEPIGHTGPSAQSPYRGGVSGAACMTDHVIGLDGSTSATKAVLVDEAGRVVATGVSEYSYQPPAPLWSEVLSPGLNHAQRWGFSNDEALVD